MAPPAAAAEFSWNRQFSMMPDAPKASTAPPAVALPEEKSQPLRVRLVPD